MEIIENSSGVLLLGINLFIQGSPNTCLTLQSESIGTQRLKKIRGYENNFGYIWKNEPWCQIITFTEFKIQGRMTYQNVRLRTKFTLIVV